MTENPSINPEKPQQDGLTVGMIALIGVGSAVLVASVAVVVLFLRQKNNRRD